jgi:hypothetical protein
MHGLTLALVGISERVCCLQTWPVCERQHRDEARAEVCAVCEMNGIRNGAYNQLLVQFSNIPFISE